MDASRPMIRGVSLADEKAQLERLWKECEQFLGSWGAYKWSHEESPTDAVVAVLELQVSIVARLSYLMGLQHQQDLPF